MSHIDRQITSRYPQAKYLADKPKRRVYRRYFADTSQWDLLRINSLDGLSFIFPIFFGKCKIDAKVPYTVIFSAQKVKHIRKIKRAC